MAEDPTTKPTEVVPPPGLFITVLKHHPSSHGFPRQACRPLGNSTLAGQGRYRLGSLYQFGCCCSASSCVFPA